MMTRNAQPSSQPRSRSERLSYEEFRDLLIPRARPLLAVAMQIRRCRRIQAFLTRPLLAEFYSQAALTEELLDTYGAQTNRRWNPFRSIIAAGKQFASVHYTLLHIQHSLPDYRLVPVEGDFERDTRRSLGFTGKVIQRVARALTEEAGRLGVPVPDTFPPEEVYAEALPAGRLPRDRSTRRTESAGATIARLTTAFLRQAAESELLHLPAKVHAKNYASCIPYPVNEQELRGLAEDYHNLQSLYDTHVSDTRTESVDEDLPVLRGHVSVIFHLLEAATGLTHYYERHMVPHSVDSARARRLCVVPDKVLLRTIMDYCLCYASRYLQSAQDLCQRMLRRYAERGRVTVTAPRYRGFHVRPATLVAKVVRHYGSEVQMELDGEAYDASSPMEIFRANEKINAKKRRWLAEEVIRLRPERMEGMESDFPAAMRRLVLMLGEQGKVVIYEQPLQIEERSAPDGVNPAERAIQEVSRLQATGQIDVETEIRVTFIGDKRVLSDLKLLAETGYGEDNFGNNIDLPEKLSYLRQ